MGMTRVENTREDIGEINMIKVCICVKLLKNKKDYSLRNQSILMLGEAFRTMAFGPVVIMTMVQTSGKRVEHPDRVCVTLVQEQRP